ncbi:lysozyme inhibitor LprI family protein [Methylicorpusculum sp.]|uniref:lysozyme inhibitor LprI family protein n=1 Tax=Methylicorpusculum sp. TaxID=2713644 RepID=UPI00272A211B|nr:lysozyme inhibitor LprI family protein [Methylicorpusculum sp.]
MQPWITTPVAPMKKYFDINTNLAVITILLLPAYSAMSSDAVQSCNDGAQTQLDINHCGSLDFQSADKELNAVYKAVLEQHKTNIKFLEKLKAAQRAWLKWRDAEMEAVYPEKDAPSYYGSSFPACRNTQLSNLTQERTKQLQKWLDGVEEGDVCSGSYPSSFKK